MIPQQKIKSPKTVACIMLGLLFFAGVIVFFTLGGVFYAKQGPRVSHYANTMCTVDSRSWKMYQCKSRYYYYTCYGPIWGVHYKLDRPISATVEQDERYSSYSDALNKAYQYQIGSNYSCWYDQRNPTVAQWDKPSTTVAIILLSCGGLSILLSILMFFLASRIFRQQMMQNRVDMPPPYTVANSYRKY